MSDEWTNAIVVAVVAVVAGGIFGLGAWAGYSDARDSRHLPPCGYGATEVMVREANGNARVVCACGRMP